MKDTFSVLVPDGETLAPLLVARCLAQVPGTKLYILSSKRWTLGRFSRHCRLYQFRPIEDDDAWLRSLIQFIEQHSIDILLPVSEKGVEFVSSHYQVLSDVVALPPIPDPEAFRTARNKWLLNQLACKQDVPAPPAILATLDSAFYQQLSDLEYPVIIKPAIGRGGGGIRRFDTQSDLEKFLEGQDEEQFRDRYLVQHYVPGTNLGLNVLCREGELLAFTVQRCLKSRPFGPPEAIQFIEQEDVLENGRRLLSALRWSGYANIDMQYDSRNGDVFILEVNARFWLTLIGSLVAGVNFPYLSCLEALGIPFSRPRYHIGRKYVQTGTAVKEIVLQPFGRSKLGGFAFRETGLRFCLADPLPEVVNLAARGATHHRGRRLIPAKAREFFDEISA
jgi:D-aspartate ligase